MGEFIGNSRIQKVTLYGVNIQVRRFCAVSMYPIRQYSCVNMVANSGVIRQRPGTRRHASTSEEPKRAQEYKYRQ
jgi:hypothetical protein